MVLCDYGCGQEAKYFFKNGKKCCSKNHGSCPNRKLSIFNRDDYKSFTKKITCKYCEEKFIVGSLSRHENSCLLNPINKTYCLSCGILLKKRHQKIFCSSRCSGLYNSPGRKHSEETKNKISNGVKKVSPTRPDGIRTPLIVTQNCPICGIRKEYLTTSPKYKPRQTCSEKCLSKLLTKVSIESGCGGYRENSTRGKSGRYKGIFCASSYELIFVAYHLNIGSNLKPCRIKIPYVYKGKSHNYHPDFFIDDKIYEIKGFYREIVDVKTQAAINAGYEIDVLYLEDIQYMLDYLKEKYKFKNILEIYD